MSNLTKYDIWHTKYYYGATFAGNYEMPVLKGTTEVPKGIIRFSDSKSKSRDNPDAWIVPYEHDTKLECMWRNAFKYEKALLKHPGIISWDFSMYRNMPFSLQLWNCFRGRLLGSQHERLGGTCIPNIRPSDIRTLAFALDGIAPETTIAMGTAGNLKHSDDRAIFEFYVNEIVKRLHPANIIVYGDAPEQIFHAAYDASINVVSFFTQTQNAHNKRKNT